MRTTLDLDADVMAVVREMAKADGRSIGTVVSELVRRGLAPARVDTAGDLPVIRVPAGSPVITPEMVRLADEDR
ncbi:antitoxin [soil metagenome]